MRGTIVLAISRVARFWHPNNPVGNLDISRNANSFSAMSLLGCQVRWVGSGDELYELDLETQIKSPDVFLKM